MRNELNKIADKLSPESQKRIDQNPMRVLDSKDENDLALTATMPLITEHLNEACALHFEKVKSLLTAFDIPFIVDGRLVRGLDYYTKTAFEVSSTELGSQDALAGGGRYDLLVQELGGKPTPGIGFAGGMERLMMVLEKKNFQSPEIFPTLFISAADENSRTWVLKTAMHLRANGIAVEVDLMNRSLKAQMREADRQKVKYALVIGEHEIQTGKALLIRRGESTRTQQEIDLTQLDSLQKLLES